MDLRDKITPSRRIAELILRFRFPLLLVFVVLFFFHTESIKSFISSVGAMNSTSILMGTLSFNPVIDFYAAYGASTLLIAGGLIVYLIGRLVLISWSTTIVQILLPLFFFLLGVLANDSTFPIEYVVYGILGVFFVAMAFVRFEWIQSLFPLVVTSIAITALYLQCLTFFGDLQQPSMILLWHGLLSVLMGDALLFVSKISKEIKKGKAKLGAVALYYDGFMPSLMKISGVVLALLCIGLIPSIGLPQSLVVQAILTYVIYLFSVLIFIPILFSFIPYQRLFKK